MLRKVTRIMLSLAFVSGSAMAGCAGKGGPAEPAFCNPGANGPQYNGAGGSGTFAPGHAPGSGTGASPYAPQPAAPQSPPAGSGLR